MNIIQQLTKELNVRQSQVEAAVSLIDEGNTIPFIARYRKEATGSLNDEVLRNLDERLKYLRSLEEKKQQVLDTIRSQGNLTAELEDRIEAAQTMVAVEDLYRPFRPKRRTRAMIAKEKGLDPLAQTILGQQLKVSLQEEAAKYISEDKGVSSADDALSGALDILAELFSDNAEYRTWIRGITRSEGHLTASTKDDTLSSVYEMYYHYNEPISRAARHRILALNRGEKENILSVKILAPVDQILTWLERRIITGHNVHTDPALKTAIADSYDRLIAPSIERELRSELTDAAEAGAIDVFGKNLKQLLMQPPVAGQVVLGWDPAFRTGCKLAVVDPTGKVLDTVVIFPTAPQNKVEESLRVLKGLIRKYHVTLISLGNGTASRESEQIIVRLLKEIGGGVSYAIVSEAGASVYSASKLATEEFPQFDVGQRSAASIARRLQDPLAELVKIDPKAIGVGQYQHDMNQKKLDESLAAVVEDAVNKVGVDVNTASAALLEHVSGITRTIARNIVIYREANGAFKNRRDLLKVEKLGPKAFEQCAGFLRIRGGKNPLDATAVHPESYEAAEKLIRELGYRPEDIGSKGNSTQEGIAGIRSKVTDTRAMAEHLGIGEITLKDILSELEKPSRDPRSEMPGPILRTDVLDMKDLQPGMILKGTVRNIVDFGAFVDIGVHHDGLVHISQMSTRRIQHPLEVVSVGDIVEVQVMSVDQVRQRIQLTMKIDR